jgi:precorrin-8X/cobalt-precorrin-8 methylmutase
MWDDSRGEVEMADALNRPGLVEAGRTIEMKSFQIIDDEMRGHSFPQDEWQIIRRVIHTTGDFEYAPLFRFHPLAIGAGMEALKKGATIVTDTRMIKVGLSPWRLSRFGNAVITPAAEPESQSWAEALGTTRTVAAFRHVRSMLQDSIVAIGNAPTALLEVLRLIAEEDIRPALVIGVPVGFVQAAESKDGLWRQNQQPAITIFGRKGGSTVAVAILHGLMELAGAGQQGRSK